jgi:tetratricopeptide (TPR) repeat protein
MERMSAKSRRAVAVVAAVFLLVAGGLTAFYLTSNRREVTTSSAEAYEAYRQGVEASRRYYSKEAQADFARALSLDPNFAMAMIRLAGLSNQEQAKALCARAARLRPRLNDHERMYIDLIAAGDAGKREERLRIARAILEKYPDDIEAAMVLAENAMSLGESDKAIQIYSELLALDPNNAVIYNFFGYYYAYRGDYDRAIENLKKYQFMAPDQANPFDSLGEVQAYSGRYDEAIANLNRALSLKPDFFESLFHMGIAYEGKGDYARAIDYFYRAEREAFPDGRRMDMLASAFRVELLTGDRAAVRETAKRVAALPRGKNSEIWQDVADTVVDLVEDRTSEAERRLNDVKPKMLEAYAREVTDKEKRPPYFPYWNIMMAIVKQRQGKADEAIALWEANTKPPIPWSNFEGRRLVFEARAYLAELLARKGDLDRAEKLLAENKKWNPSWAPTRASELVVEQMRRDKVLAASGAPAPAR